MKILASWLVFILAFPLFAQEKEFTVTLNPQERTVVVIVNSDKNFKSYYAVIVNKGDTPPSATQIINGKDHDGSNAKLYFNMTGKLYNFAGLREYRDYTMYMVAKRTDGTYSSIVSYDFKTIDKTTPSIDYSSTGIEVMGESSVNFQGRASEDVTFYCLVIKKTDNHKHPSAQQITEGKKYNDSKVSENQHLIKYWAHAFSYNLGIIKGLEEDRYYWAYIVAKDLSGKLSDIKKFEFKTNDVTPPILSNLKLISTIDDSGEIKGEIRFLSNEDGKVGYQIDYAWNYMLNDKGKYNIPTSEEVVKGLKRYTESEIATPYAGIKVSANTEKVIPIKLEGNAPYVAMVVVEDDEGNLSKVLHTDIIITPFDSRVPVIIPDSIRIKDTFIRLLSDKKADEKLCVEAFFSEPSDTLLPVEQFIKKEFSNHRKDCFVRNRWVEPMFGYLKRDHAYDMYLRVVDLSGNYKYICKNIKTNNNNSYNTPKRPDFTINSVKSSNDTLIIDFNCDASTEHIYFSISKDETETPNALLTKTGHMNDFTKSKKHGKVTVKSKHIIKISGLENGENQRVFLTVADNSGYLSKVKYREFSISISNDETTTTEEENDDNSDSNEEDVVNDDETNAEVNDDSTLIEDKDININLHIFPNPAEDIINIKSKDNISEIIIFDSKGRKIMSVPTKKIKQNRSENINVSNLPKGIYIVELYSGHLKYHSRFVKL